MALASPSSDHSALTGMLLAGVAFALTTSVDTIFKIMAENHPAHQILLVNACFALIPVLAWALLTGGFAERLKTARPFRHLARGCISVSSAFAAIFAYSRLPLTDFYAIVFAGPLIVTAMSSIWLGEKVERSRWLAIIAGFLGILVVANPFEILSEAQNATAMAGRVAALVSILCYSFSVIMIRRMRLSETNLTFSFYGYCAAILVGGAVFLLRGGPELSSSDIAHLALSGMLAGIATICMMTAWHRTQVSLVAPFQYTQIIWGAVAGYVLWNHTPEVRVILGAVIVAACGLFVIYREMHPLPKA